MRVLALTHAHLDIRGLSPVSCERADSVTGTWADKLNWQVDVVHTKGTRWVGIWPGGKGLKFDIREVVAPNELMKTEPVLFSVQMKSMLAKKNFTGITALLFKRISKRVRGKLVDLGFAWPEDLVVAKKWGDILSAQLQPRNAGYDFIFVCVGYGDEYLLQTGLTLSEKWKVPMVVDYRDLWSEHHDPNRFTPEQSKKIRAIEVRLLATTKMISVPQKHLKKLMEEWNKVPVYHLAHSAYVGPGWSDGKVVSDEFRILYAGKLYADGPGITMFLEVLKQLPTEVYNKPVACHFYVDDTAALKKLIAEYGIKIKVEINEWVAPSELWGRIRSAHLLVIIDSSTLENYPILLTKTFQYAYTGQKILCIQKYDNPEMEEFLAHHQAGLVTTDVNTASDWVVKFAATESLYKILPPLRNIPLRPEIAAAFGREIEKVFGR